MPDIHKIIKIGDSLAVIIPAHISRELNWQRGDFVRFEVTEEDVVRIIRFNDFLGV